MHQTTRKRLGVRKIANRTTCCLIVMMLYACGEQEQVHTYSSPKDSTVAVAPFAPSGVMGAPTMTDAQAFVWELPDGWEEESGGGPMRFATLTGGAVETGGEAASKITVTVARLPSRAGSLLANVNRWQGQMGLADVGETGLTELLHPLESGASPGTVVDLLGPAPADSEGQQERMIAAIFKSRDATWFFKARAGLDVIAAAEPELMDLFRSVRSVETAHTNPHAHSTSALLDGGPPSIGPLRYEVPEGWRFDPQPRTARLGTLVFSDGSASGDLAITRFPGDVGGELANVNRWRGQLGLSPVADLNQQIVSDIQIGGLPGKSYRFAAAGEGPMRPGIVVASVMRNGQSWFFKMTGSDLLLGDQVENYNLFIASIHFDGN